MAKLTEHQENVKRVIDMLGPLDELTERAMRRTFLALSDPTLDRMRYDLETESSPSPPTDIEAAYARLVGAERALEIAENDATLVVVQNQNEGCGGDRKMTTAQWELLREIARGLGAVRSQIRGLGVLLGKRQGFAPARVKE
jgi:hypothetical protein